MTSKTSNHASAVAPARPLLLLLAGLLLVGTASAAVASEPLFARMDTEAGEILLVLYPDLAPHHVDNFVHLGRTGFYDGTSFHRIVPGFVIQGGDPNSKDEDPRNDGMGGPTVADVLTPDALATVDDLNRKLAARGYAEITPQASLKAEFSTTVKHLRGTLSMARGPADDSAGSQFFICVANTEQLDGKYTVFGHVVLGMDVADAIVSAETNPAAGRQAPAEPVHIRKVTIIEGTDGLTPDESQAWQELPADLKNVE